MKKRLASLLLALCMILSLLPGTAYAAVADLLENTAQQNQSLLQQLESFTGESYEEAYALLDSLGLLDGDGNLVTDQSIVLDGVEYTLDQIEALLADPSVDLTQVATVDGVPIALSDLKTIIAIERQLQYLQETYFTGRTFDGEALENVNDLLNQLQNEGMTLNADARSTEDRIVFDTNNLQQTSSDGRLIYYISTGTVTIPAGTTLTVKFKLNLSDAIKNMMLGTSPVIYLSDTAESSTLTSNYLDKSTGANSAVVYIQNGSTQFAEYSLSIKANYPYEGPLYLCLQGPSLQDTSVMNYEEDFANYSFGKIWQAVSFYDASGFFFQNGSGGVLRDQWNGYFSVTHAIPDMKTSWSNASGWSSTNGNVSSIVFTLARNTDLKNLETTLTYLQRCIDNLSRDNALRVAVTATLSQTNTDGTESRTLITPRDVFLGANPSIDANSATGVDPFNLLPGDGNTADVSFDIFSTDILTGSGEKTYSLLKLLYMPICQRADVTWEQIRDNPDIDEKYTYYVDSYTATTKRSSYTLKSEKNKPTLTVSAPAGNYQSGDVIPITITGNEYIQANNARITINGTEYSLSDLHASSSGKYMAIPHRKVGAILPEVI